MLQCIARGGGLSSQSIGVIHYFTGAACGKSIVFSAESATLCVCIVQNDQFSALVSTVSVHF